MSTITKNHLMSTIFKDDTKELKKLLKSSKLSQLPVLRGGYDLLKMAVRRKRVKAAELLSKKIKISNKVKFDRPSNFLLHDAVRLRQSKVVKILVSRGANVNSHIRNGMTPLHIASKYGCLKIMDHLLKNGADVNSRCTGPYFLGYTPLHFACQSNKLNCAKLLIENNATVVPKNRDDINPIHISTCFLMLKITALLLKYGAYVSVDVRLDKKYYFIEGFVLDTNNIYKKVREATYIHALKSLTLLHYAVFRNAASIVKLLIKYEADIDLSNNCGEYPLIDAVRNTNLQMVKLLLDNGAVIKFDADRPTITYYVLASNRIMKSLYCKHEYSLANEKLEIIKMLIRKGAIFDNPEFDKNFLNRSIYCGYRDIANYLMNCTHYNYYQTEDWGLDLVPFKEDKVTPDIAGDTEYIMKRKLEIKELAYDVIYRRILRISVGAEGPTFNADDIFGVGNRIGVTDEEHRSRVLEQWAEIRGIAEDLTCEKICDTTVTLFDILNFRMDRLVKFAANEDD
ncbi:putative ankyrin repeat protein RF_0381 [Microplitis mediator]|uniref:putative ankyrin repeat protein RF_0381 n=1 Tax=Microplitis mediator TaxID=375433 RepID=UPI002557600F|nr:putative ankyrin repeat protein RF_0381 [Microplitis mediator]